MKMPANSFDKILRQPTDHSNISTFLCRPQGTKLYRSDLRSGTNVYAGMTMVDLMNTLAIASWAGLQNPTSTARLIVAPKYADVYSERLLANIAHFSNIPLAEVTKNARVLEPTRKIDHLAEELERLSLVKNHVRVLQPSADEQANQTNSQPGRIAITAVNDGRIYRLANGLTKITEENKFGRRLLFAGINSRDYVAHQANLAKTAVPLYSESTEADPRLYQPTNDYRLEELTADRLIEQIDSTIFARMAFDAFGRLFKLTNGL